MLRDSLRRANRGGWSPLMPATWKSRLPQIKRLDPAPGRGRRVACGPSRWPRPGAPGGRAPRVETGGPQANRSGRSRPVPVPGRDQLRNLGALVLVLLRVRDDPRAAPALAGADRRGAYARLSQLLAECGKGPR